MKIVYDSENDIYCIKLNYPETELCIIADNIVEVRKRFIEMMTSVFDYTIKNSLEESKEV